MAGRVDRNDADWKTVCETTFKWLLRLLPILTFLWLFGTMWICLVIAKEYGRVGSWFPTISGVATEAPERGIFSQLINMGSFLLVVNDFLRYFYLRGFGTWYKINVIGFLVGITAAFGMSMVANFEAYYHRILHIVGAVICFIMSMVYCWIETFLTFKVLRGRDCWKCILALQSAMSIITLALLIAFFIFAGIVEFVTEPGKLDESFDVTVAEFTENNFRINYFVITMSLILMLFFTGILMSESGTEIGLTAYETWAIIEWVLVGFELAFVLTYVPDFWKWEMKMSVNDK